MKADVIKRIIFAVLTVVCMATITLFSFQSAVDSSKLSQKVVDKVLTATNKYEATDQFHKDIEASQKDYLMRDIAHISLFLALGFCLLGALSKKVTVKSMLVAFAVCILYGLFDELLQKYLGKGRAFEWSDIFEDWSGSFAGITIHYIVLLIINKRIIK